MCPKHKCLVHLSSSCGPLLCLPKSQGVLVGIQTQSATELGEGSSVLPLAVRLPPSCPLLRKETPECLHTQDRHSPMSRPSREQIVRKLGLCYRPRSPTVAQEVGTRVMGQLCPQAGAFSPKVGLDFLFSLNSCPTMATAELC